MMLDGIGGTKVFAVTGLIEGGSCDFTAIEGRPWELPIS